MAALRPPRTDREQAAALAAAIIMMVIVAAIVTSLTIMATRSAERSRDASRRVSNDATVQTAVTRIVFGYQNDLGSDQDYYVLDAADLASMTSATGNQARVVTPAQLPGLPAELATVHSAQQPSVLEHVDTAGHVLRAVAGAQLDAVYVEEDSAVEPSACTGAGLPASACDQGDVRSYWQPFRVVMPDITGNESPNVVVYVRTFLGSVTAQAYSAASYARVEMRPGRFADFQQISDGNVRIGSTASINGPVHSNGLGDGSFSTVQEATGLGDRWILAEPGVTCTGSASLSITAGVIDAPGSCNSLGATGQTISFLRAIDAIQSIRDANAAGRAGTAVFSGAAHRGAETLQEPYHTAWRVELQGSSMTVSYPDGTFAGTYGLGRVNAFVFDEDVRVRGTVGADRRVTIAAERDGGASASIYVDGDLVKGDDRTSSIGLLAQGDVVLWMFPPNNCPVGTMQAAVVAASGGVTIPTRFTTNELQTNVPNCTGAVVIDGSLAGHRPPTLVWTWPGVPAAGYAGTRDYRWDQELKRNPPPFFPLTGLWQPFQVREANVDCLFDDNRKLDPKCR
jgi:hypothetical protein